MQYKVVKKHTGTLTSTDGNPIDFDLYAPHNDTSSLPVLLFLHGFKGFKDWGTFPDAFFEMARNGFAVLAMNFSYDGINHETTLVDKPDLFYTQTISQEIEDVRIVVDAVMTGKIAQNSGLGDLYPLGIIGHSRGGLTAIVAAAEIDDITCLVTWGAVADSIDFLGPDAIHEWSTKGHTEITNSRTGQTLKIVENSSTIFSQTELNFLPNTGQKNSTSHVCSSTATTMKPCPICMPRNSMKPVPVSKKKNTSSKERHTHSEVLTHLTTKNYQNTLRKSSIKPFGGFRPISSD
jgi:hypothetical protein